MVEESIVSAVKQITGDSGILLGKDVSERKAGIWIEEPIKAQAIIRPKSTQELSEILTLCNKNKLPVVPHGGLTGLSQAAITKSNEIVISTERMTKIENIDPIGRTLTAQSGVKLQTIQEAAESEDMYFPLDLGARGSCTIGGNASTNAGGNKVIRYGMTRDLVLGLEAVLADGTIISSINSCFKS